MAGGLLDLGCLYLCLLIFCVIMLDKFALMNFVLILCLLLCCFWLLVWVCGLVRCICLVFSAYKVSIGDLCSGLLSFAWSIVGQCIFGVAYFTGSVFDVGSCWCLRGLSCYLWGVGLQSIFAVCLPLGCQFVAFWFVVICLSFVFRFVL